MFQHQRAFLADRRREFLRQHGQQPRQGDLETYVVVGDVDEADGALAERAEIEGEPIAAPGFLADGEERGIVRPRRGEAGLDAAARLLASEAVGNGNNQGPGQVNLRGWQLLYSHGPILQSAFLGLFVSECRYYCDRWSWAAGRAHSRRRRDSRASCPCAASDARAITGGTRLAERRAMLLHPLAGRVPLGRALSMAGCGGRNQQSRRRGNR